MSRRCSIPIAKLIAGIASVSLSLLTGCSLSPSLPFSGPVPTTGTISISGHVHGGQNPVYHSLIGLWQAGNTGTTSASYGANATNLMTSTVYTGVDGSFNITGLYNSCTSGSQVYITSYGGDPTDTTPYSSSNNNANIMLVAALGLCDNISSSTTVQINELTTVAAAFGLGQFFGGFGTTGGTGDLIGAPTTNTKGLINAFATTRNLVNTATGAPATTTVAANSFYMTGNDQAKLYTEANIIAACVNQTTFSVSTNCSSLYTAVTPIHPPLTTTGTATQPTDTFQAAVYLSLNPTSTNASSSSTNMTTLYGLASGYPAFNNALSAAPNDWTLALSYDGTGIDNLAGAAVDANGDIWFINGNGSGTNGGGFVVLNGGSGTAGGTVGVTGGQIGYYTSGTYGSGPTTATVNSPRSIAIDENGYAWTANDTTSSYVFKAQSGVGVVGSYPVATTSYTLYGIAVDPTSDNIYVDSTSAVISVPEGATNGTSATITNTSGIVGSGTGPALVINSSGVAYEGPQSSSLYEFNVPNSTTNVTPTAVTSSPFSSVGTALFDAAIDGTGRVVFTNTTSTLTTVTGSGSTETTGSITNSCIQQGRELAIDGNNNIWVTNNTATMVQVNGTQTSVFTVCEFNSAGTLISAATGYGPHNISTGRGIAIDLSGNVWVTSYTAGTPNTSAAGANVTEIIGAAVPVVNPIATALKNGTMGTRP